MGPFYSYPVQASKSGSYLVRVSPPKPALSSKISPSTSLEPLPEMATLLNSQSLISPPKPALSSSFQFVPGVRLRTSSHVSRTRFHGTVRKAVVIRAAATDREFSSRRSGSNEPRETIMLPGCDYNHWLIVMEFPKDPAPTREQMIETYLNTLATVLGSMEEAKKNMYAFSTTTYTGFQCTVDEETSEKFKGLPGVLWVLPDSYIDVKNKDYGGDKYINGEIIPCQYPTYQPKQRRDSKYVSKKYERRRDGPPPQGRSRQEATQTEPVSE